MKARLVPVPGKADVPWALLTPYGRAHRRVEAWLAAGGAQRLSATDLVITCAVQCALEPADVARVLQSR